MKSAWTNLVGQRMVIGAVFACILVVAGATYYTQGTSTEVMTTVQSGQDYTVKSILLKSTDGRYTDLPVPAGVVEDPGSFTFTGYGMKTAGQFFKDSKNLYWVVFPEPVYNLPFSIIRVPNGDPKTFHVLTSGSLDAAQFAADKNQFYCGPRPFPGINPLTATVEFINGQEVVISDGNKYYLPFQLHELVTDATKTCERAVGKRFE